MDKKIEDFKKYYLQTPPPMEVGKGFAQILTRIDEEKSTPFYFSRIFITAILFLLVSTGVAGAVLLSPDNTTLNAVKAAARRVVEHTFNISGSTIVLPTSTINKKTPTPTPSSTPTEIEKDSDHKKSYESLKQENKDKDEQEVNESSNQTDVKGVSDENKPATNDNEEADNSQNNLEDNSDDHKNENAADSRENPSTEQPNGKSKN